MRVLLIAGAWSPEREVSLKGAKIIAETLRKRGHLVTELDPKDSFDKIIEIAKEHDFTFLNLHGAPGEDGLIQALLTVANCAFQGSDALGSILALHKAASKQIFKLNNILTPEWEYVTQMPKAGWRSRFEFPIFVKANKGGSSLHAAKVRNQAELMNALQEIFSFGDEVIIEPAIVGQELTCGVLGNQNAQALPVILIVSKTEFFDYSSKYDQDGALELCPAPISNELTKRVQDIALQVHNLLKLKSYSRADFLYDEQADLLYLLEVNTLPGMTATSLVPKEAASIGLDFGDLLEELIVLGLENNANCTI